MKCKRCGKEYDADDDKEDDSVDDPEWQAEMEWMNGRCYWCHIKFLYDIYGGMLEPDFEFREPGPPTSNVADCNIEIPF